MDNLITEAGLFFGQIEKSQNAAGAVAKKPEL